VRKSLLTILVVGASLLVAGPLSGCSSSSATAKAAKAATTVVLNHDRFTPANLTVPLNATLTIKNQDTVEHSYILQGQNIGTEVSAGQTRPLHLDGVPAGSYMVYCEEPGHMTAGMVGNLTITQ